jgi:hypothetical protein
MASSRPLVVCEVMELIAKQDMLNGVKAGQRFEAPDMILVALGLAEVAPAETEDATEPSDGVETPRRRRRARGASTL